MLNQLVYLLLKEKLTHVIYILVFYLLSGVTFRSIERRGPCTSIAHTIILGDIYKQQQLI